MALGEKVVRGRRQWKGLTVARAHQFASARLFILRGALFKNAAFDG